MTLIFYDIATRSGETISPNAWKTKLCLGLKKITFETKRVALHEVQKVLAEDGFPPASKKPDGSPHYTVPAIHDLSTGVKLSDSWEIALYLDKTYPNTHQLFPSGTIALQRAFYDSFPQHFIAGFPFIIAKSADIQVPEAASHFAANIRRMTGKSLDEVEPKGEAAVTEWAKYKAGLDKLEAWYSASGGKFLMGDAPVWADIPVVSFIIVQRRVWGRDGQRWKDVSSWNGGRWAALVAYFDDLNIV